MAPPKEDKEKQGEKAEASGDAGLPPMLIEARKIAAAIVAQQKMEANQEADAAKRMSRKRPKHDLSDSGSSDHESSDGEDTSMDESSDEEFHGFSSRDVAAAERAAVGVARPGSSRQDIPAALGAPPSAPGAVPGVSSGGQNLASLVQTYMSQGQNQIGLPIDEQLVHLLVKVWENGDKLKLDSDLLFDRIKPPANTPFLQVVELNPAIMNEAKRKSFVLNRDIALKAIQKTLVKSGQAMSYLADKICQIVTEQGPRQECIDLLVDAMDCLAMANGKVQLSRKFNLKACIAPMYHPILKKSGTAGGLLIPNLIQEMRDCEDNEKLRQKARNKRGGYFKKGKFGKFSRKKHNGKKKFIAFVEDYHVSETNQGPVQGALESVVLNILSELCNDSQKIEEKSQSCLRESAHKFDFEFSINQTDHANQHHVELLTEMEECGCRSPREPPGRSRASSWQPGPECQSQQPQLSSLYEQPSPAQVCTYSQNMPVKFRAEGIKFCVPEWQKITSDANILGMVKGVSLEFGKLPIQKHIPRQIKFSESEKIAVDDEIQKMLSKKVIEIVDHSKGEYISNLFTRPKRDSADLRAILNMKSINENIVYRHFKVDDLPHALTLIRPHYYMAVIDIKEGFHNVSVNRDFRKYLRFEYDGVLYQYTAMPNGMASAPRYFTKLLKVPLAFLREKFGILCSAFFDDIIVVMATIEGLRNHVKLIIDLLEKLGFIINYEKSWLNGYLVMKYLGMILNSKQMMVYLPEEKILAIKKLAAKLLEMNEVRIRTFASFIGMCVATFPGNKYGPLHSKLLEQEKNAALDRTHHDFDQYMNISDEMRKEITWWLNNVHACYKEIFVGEPDKIIYTDSSKSGYGFHEPSSGKKGGGHWSEEESKKHINQLEIRAARFAVVACYNELQGKHIRVFSDNSTTVSGISHQGSVRSKACDKEVHLIWEWAESRNCWLSAAFVPGVKNVEADEKSRKFNPDIEWSLADDIFHQICEEFGKPDIDLFASRLNYKIKPFCSWTPEPGAAYVDAYTVNWEKFNLPYIFPAFSQLPTVLQHLEQFQQEVILVAPWWPTQSWFATMARLVASIPRIIKVKPKTLVLKHDLTQQHPLVGKLHLIAVKLSSKDTVVEDFLSQYQRSCLGLGKKVLDNNMESTLNSGINIVCRGVSVKPKPLFHKP